MAKNIDTKLKNIQGIFSNSADSILAKDGKLIIPDYQRAYNWKSNEQCDTLWQDIESFIENKKNESYFFGSIIINNDDNKLYVIDGQQRITTFMLLLKALLIKINDILENIPADEDADDMKDKLKNRRRSIINCLYSIDEDDVSSVIKGNKKLSDLIIKYENKSINEEYCEELKIILQGESLDEIEKKVKKIPYKQKENRYTNFFRNFKFFLSKIKDFDSTKINRFTRALLEECQLIVVISYQTEEAIEIFNSLNSTGMPLADADIISAKLYSNYGTDTVSFNKSWSEIIKTTNILGTKKIVAIDDILNQYMYILRAKRGEKDTALPGVRRYFTDINKDALKNPRKFISDIEKIINIWNEQNNSKELETLKQILLKHNNNFKFFYATYFYFYENETDAKKQEFVETLLKLFAILAIVERGYSSAEFKIYLIALNMKIGTGVSTNVIIQDLKEHIKKNFNKNNIQQIIINSNPNNAVIYLNEYLFAKETNTDVTFDVSKIEIEHIMPASGRNTPHIREDAGMNEEEFEQYSNKIGNKILLEQAINAAIGRDWFATKKQKSIHIKRGYNRARAFTIGIKSWKARRQGRERLCSVYAFC